MQRIYFMEITFYDEWGTAIDSSLIDPYADYMWPGEKAPFKEWIYPEPLGWVDYEIELYYYGYEPWPGEGREVSGFLEVSYHYDMDGDLHFEGRAVIIASNGVLPVYVTLYDASGQIVNCDVDYVSKALPEFDIEIDHDEPTQGWIRYALEGAYLP